MSIQAEMFPVSGPGFDFENRFGGRIAGVDEVGRGPLAGPVVAAAVILDRDCVPEGLDDSKRLTRRERERLYDQLLHNAMYAVGAASVAEIDQFNILAASLLAMRRAVAGLSLQPDVCLVDGNQDPGLNIPTKCLVKGDRISLSVAAASIIAKVTRDRIMAELAEEYPEFGWDKNAGYGVPHHLEALRVVGSTPHHRKSFAPVRDLVSEDSLINY